MQHLAVARQADLVLLRPEDVAEEWNRVIPAGSWREGKSALAAATAFLMKISPEDLKILRPRILSRLSAFGRPFFPFTLAGMGLRQLDGDPPALLSPEPFRGRPYLLVSGVGSPAQVETTARDLMGVFPARHLAYADHHPYRPCDARTILRQADGLDSDIPILCTAKDGVKLLAYRNIFRPHPLLALETEVVFGPALFTSAAFPLWWEDWWREQSLLFQS
jgi:tetraacyldisaccharide 4'-kinase